MSSKVVEGHPKPKTKSGLSKEPPKRRRGGVYTDKFKVIGAVFDGSALESYICKSHYTRKWENKFEVPPDPELSLQKRRVLWWDVQEGAHKGDLLTVEFKNLKGDIPTDVVRGYYERI